MTTAPVQDLRVFRGTAFLFVSALVFVYLSAIGQGFAQSCVLRTSESLDDGLKRCFATLSSSGGTVDARELSGTQVSISNVFEGVKNRFTVQFGSVQISVAVPWVVDADGVTIAGAGRQRTVISQANGVNTGLAVIVAGGHRTVSDFTIRDLTVDGNKVHNSRHSAGVFLKNVQSGVVQNVEVRNSPDIGFGFGDGAKPGPTTSDVDIRNCYSHENGGNGFDANNASNLRFVSNRAEHNGVSSGGDGFYLGTESPGASAGDVTYTENVAEGNGGSGFHANSSSGVTGKVDYIRNIAKANITVKGSAGNAFYLSQSGRGTMAGPFNLQSNTADANAVNSVVVFGKVKVYTSTGNNFGARTAFRFLGLFGAIIMLTMCFAASRVHRHGKWLSE